MTSPYGGLLLSLQVLSSGNRLFYLINSGPTNGKIRNINNGQDYFPPYAINQYITIDSPADRKYEISNNGSENEAFAIWGTIASYEIV